ncbi:hypothetical protein, partial [Alistipes putredinis]|uniref:hypothetical protein n=1 Tax=Alistipes putredinis TaxID=28117 RepID=UPI003A931FAF
RLPPLSNAYFALSSSLIPLIFTFIVLLYFWFVVSVVAVSELAAACGGFAHAASPPAGGNGARLPIGGAPQRTARILARIGISNSPSATSLHP